VATSRLVDYEAAAIPEEFLELLSGCLKAQNTALYQRFWGTEPS